MPFMSKSKKLIKAVTKRMVRGAPPLMPLSNQTSGVAGVLQGLGNRHFLDRQSDTGLFITIADRIKFISKPVRRTPGQQARPGWAAIWTGHIPCSKTNATLCNRIDMRCRYFRISLTAQLAVTKIISKEYNDIWACIIR